MKIPVFLLVLLLCLTSLPNVQAEEYGKLRAMQQRAVEVIRKKNDFISRVLTSYAIPHERTEEGAVLRITIDGRLVDITKIEIIPLLKEETDKKLRVASHELLFYTPQGILSLESELVVK